VEGRSPISNVWCRPGYFNWYSASLRTGRLALGPTQPAVPWESSDFRGVKRPGAWRETSTPCSAEVKETIGLYFDSPSGPSWPVIGWTLLYHFYFKYLKRDEMKCYILLKHMLRRGDEWAGLSILAGVGSWRCQISNLLSSVNAQVLYFVRRHSCGDLPSSSTCRVLTTVSVLCSHKTTQWFKEKLFYRTN